MLRGLIAHSLEHFWGEEEKVEEVKRLTGLLVIPKAIVDYQHFELTSREYGVSVCQERSYNPDNVYLTCHLEKTVRNYM